MSYNNLSLVHRIERVAINTIAAGLGFLALLHGPGVASDVQGLRNDQVATAYYDHLPGTTPAMVAEEQTVLDRDTAALRVDAAAMLTGLFAAVGILYFGNKLLDQVDRPLPEQAEPVADQIQD